MTLTEALREALVDAKFKGLGTWKNQPSVHTRRPAPKDAGYPMIMVSPNITKGDQDLMNAFVEVIQRDIAVYGEAVDHYRIVEQIAEEVRVLFHRQKILEVADSHVIDITATGPIPGPTDDDSKIARIVTLTIRLQKGVEDDD